MANKIKYGGKYISYKQAVMRETGMTSQQYTREYDVFKHRVRNWNIATGNIGTDKALSPAETFYYYKQAQQRGYSNSLTDAIINVASTTTKKAPQSTFEIVANRDRIVFDNFMYKNVGGEIVERSNQYAQEAIKAFDAYDNGEIDAKQLHQKMLRLADGLKKSQEDGMVGSE